jgi:hypothetical protein
MRIVDSCGQVNEIMQIGPIFSFADSLAIYVRDEFLNDSRLEAEPEFANPVEHCPSRPT